MSHATITTTTFSDTVARLFARIANSRQETSSGQLHNALRCAYKAFAAENVILVKGLFDKRFLAEHGEAIVAAYMNGRLSRHQAAVDLAHAWEANVLPANVTMRKVYVADAAMTADRFLSYLPV